MNITERMLLEGAMENRSVSSPKSAIHRAYLRTLVEEETLPIRQEKPIKTVFTSIGEGSGENVRKKKRKVKWGRGGRW